MRSLLEVKTEIAEIMADKFESIKNGGGNLENAMNRARRRLQFLRMVEMYLEGNPTDYFIVKEIGRLENRVNKIIDLFCEDMYKKFKNPKQEYEKEMGVPHLRLQLKALRFIKK